MKTFNNNAQVSFKEGERPRKELELPQLHFIVMDDWIEVIGEKAFLAWLKMFTWTDRKGAKQNPDLWNESRIPTSLNNVRKKLKMGNGTFYNQIIKPLWNVGLIDLEIYEDSEQKGHKPVNITVYKYPQNKFALAVEPLEIVRDYDKDYSSTARTFAKINAEKRKENKGCSEREQGVVLNENKGLFQNRTRGCSEIEHNNISNTLNNNLNSINNISNLSIKESVEKAELPSNLKKTLIDKIDTLEEFEIKISDIVIHFQGVKDNFKEGEYNFVLNCLLKNMIDKPKSFSAVMNDWLKRNREKKDAAVKSFEVVKKPTRSEMLPEWFDEDNKTQEPVKKRDKKESRFDGLTLDEQLALLRQPKTE